MGFDHLNGMWTAVFPLAVLLYYFFRKKYVSTTISSTLFWQTSMRETKVSPYLKNLQRNALFYLQMAALLLLVFILLGPYLPKDEEVAEHTVFIVDTSASMAAKDGDNSLFDQNKKKMMELAKDKTGQAISIITTGKEPALVIREERDEHSVLGAIDQLDLNYEQEQMQRSLDFVKSLASEGGVDVHIFTDFLDRSIFMESENGIRWTVHANNRPLANMSIEKFGAVSTANGTEAIVKLANQTTSVQSGTLLIRNEENAVELARQEFKLDAQSQTLLSFKELPELSAIKAEIEIGDDYNLDNEAFVLLGNESSEVIIDQQLHELVKKAFEAIGLNVTSGSVNEMNVARAEALLVTNEPKFLNEGTSPILLIGRNDSATDQVSGRVETENDALFMLAPVEDVYVSELYPSFDNYETIASVSGKPFIQRSPRGDIIILTDIGLTDWPLHPSFPLFFWSATEMLTSDHNIVGMFKPNERKAILTSASSEGIEVFTIDDQYITTHPEGGSFVAPAKPGVYKLLDNGKEELLTVQLEQSEKVIKHGSGYSLGTHTISNGKEEGKNKIGWLILLPVLLLLLIEWEVQRRRGYPN